MTLGSDYDPFTEVHSAEKITETSVYTGGGRVDKPGMYHVQCIDARYIPASQDEGKTVMPNINCLFRVLAGTEPDQTDRSLYHNLYLGQWIDYKAKSWGPLEQKRFQSVLAFFHGWGTLPSSVFGAAEVKLDRRWFEGMINRCAVVRVTHKPNSEQRTDADGNVYPDRFVIAYNNHVWPVDHAKVSAVPKDPVYLAHTGTSESSSSDDMRGL